MRWSQRVVGTKEQREQLFEGVKAVVAAPFVAVPANNQTITVLETDGATPPSPVSKTFTLKLTAPVGTGDVIDCTAVSARADVAATVAVFLAARPNAAYNWSVNTSSHVDGLIGTAKNYGSAYNSAPTGTALVGGVGSITTAGADPYANPKQASLNEQTGTTYIVQISDANGVVSLNNANPITVTLPSDAVANIPPRTFVTFWMKGAGKVTFAAGSGASALVPVANALSIPPLTNSVAVWFKSSANTWLACSPLVG